MRAIAGNNRGRDLAKVLHHYGLLESSSQFKIVCPFHNDINASMKVNLIEGDFYCFGCNVSGQAEEFVKLMNPKYNDLQNLFLYYEVLRSNKVSGFKYKARSSKAVQINEQLQDVAFDYYHGLKSVNWTKSNPPEKQYMIDRGFNDKALNLCGAKPTIVNDAYPLIFPMLDMGEFKGWVCRTTNARIEKFRKYLYNEGFSRSTTLVGEYDSKVVVVVEGYMDWLKFRMFGVRKVVAILGWKMTLNQIAKLKAMGVTTIISALDMDTCGKKGTEFLGDHFKVVRFQFPKGVKDPGEMNIEQFKIANAETKRLYRRSSEDEKEKPNRRYQKQSKEVRKLKR